MGLGKREDCVMASHKIEPLDVNDKSFSEAIDKHCAFQYIKNANRLPLPTMRSVVGVEVLQGIQDAHYLFIARIEALAITLLEEGQ